MASTRAGKTFNILFLIALVIISGLIAKSIYSKQLQLRELKKQSSLLSYKINKLKSDINNIKAQIKMAKTDPYFIKQKATDRYLMINGKDETILIFSDNSSNYRQ